MAQFKMLWPLLLLLVTAACGDRDSGGGSPTPASTPASTTTAPNASPAPQSTSTGTPPPNSPSTWALPGRNELFVYTVGMGADQVAGGSDPRRVVVVQDLSTGNLLTQFLYSGKLRGVEVYPVGVELAGRQLVVATRSAVTRYELDGSNPVTLFEPPGTQRVADIAASPDGKMVAITTNCGLACRPENVLAFYEVATGRRILQVTQSAAGLEGFSGDFWQLSWAGDSHGVWVMGATYSEGGGGRAFVTTAGEVRGYTPDQWGFGTFSRSGRYFAEGVPQLGCMRVGGVALRITDMQNGEIVANITGEGGVYAAWEWSPDGDQFVFQYLAGDPSSDCAWASNPVGWRAYSLASGAVTPVADLPSLHRQWYGNRLVEAICDEPRETEPVIDRWGDWDVICRVPRAGDSPGDLFVGGERIANWPDVGPGALGLGYEPVGFLAN